MLLSNDCWMKDTCKKYQTNPDCECKITNTYCPKLFKLDYLYADANLSIPQRKSLVLYPDADGTDVAQFDVLNDIKNNISDFVRSGKNLFIYSPYPGNGKTSWTLKLVQAYFNSIWSYCDLSCHALFINVPRFLIALKANISVKNDYVQHILDNVMNCDIVVWDDIGTKAGTEFEIENLLSYINTRIDTGKTNIYTSNIIPEKLSDVVGPRLTSRIVGTSLNVGLNGMDKRGLKVE